MIILIHRKQFLKFIKTCNRIRFTVKTNQTIISLKPISIVTGIDNIINLIAGQVTFLVTDLKLFDRPAIIDIESITSPHQSFVVLAQRSYSTVRHIFFVSNLFQIIGAGCIHQYIKAAEEK